MAKDFKTPRERRGLEAFHSKFSANVTGAEEVSALLGSLGKEGREAGRSVLIEVGNRIVKKAKPLTPDDPETAGALRDSVRLSQSRASTTRGNITVSIIAGGKPLEARLIGHKYNAWALVQHEDVTQRHPHGGQAKFIEQPFLEEAPSVPAKVLDALEKLAK